MLKMRFKLRARPRVKFINKKLFFLLLKLALAAGVIFLLFKYANVDFSKVETVLKHYPLMLFLFSIVGLTIFLNSVRWVVLLKSQQMTSSVIKAYQFSLIGTFFSFLLPSSVGGDFVKGLMAARQWQEKKTKIFLSVFVDRLFGLILMMVISIIGFGFNFKLLLDVPHVLSIVKTIASLLLFGIFMLLISLKIKKINFASQKLLELKNKLLSIVDYFNSPQLVFKSFFISLFSFSSHIILFHFIFNFFDQPLPLAAFMLCVPLGIVLMSLPIAPGGVGVGQAAYFFMFNIFGEGYGETGVMAVTIMQVVYLLWAVFGALIFAFTPLKLNELKEVTDD